MQNNLHLTDKIKIRYIIVFITLILLLAIQSRSEGTNTAVRANDLLLGADISMLTQIEKYGGSFHENGKTDDCISILKKNGCNCFRLRLFVNPNYKDEVINDLPYTLALAQRIKNANMKLVLNLLYSDTRADAGHQLKPAAWSNLDFSSLEKIVEEYTATTIKHFKESGSLPDIIQIGNDITSGLLWPDGKLEGERSDYAQWDRFSRLLKAGVRGARRHLDKTDKVRIILHVDCGADISTTKWFFDNINEQNVPYDIIGLSYYPWKHGTMENLRLYLNKTGKAFGKDIIIVETAYPYNEKLWVLEKINMDWPISEKGQKKFLSDLINTVSTTTNNLGIGVLYWSPESIPVMGIDIWNNGATALFDAKGNALPALKAFNPKSNQHQ